ncbi:hypothetical protein [Dictyobacter arantiisoli]|uniref:Uncharacterized protein n=1 Tax=Dictyobacter arantiisoli TaxID=2014874 RepID=A0A5A5TJR9_9CHLR|nr:hypothetical protein [Dictyobacter arantiisoli]GCF11269.1 hypothetical protein KDI_48330 [Dictyobacter arantiisoli]
MRKTREEHYDMPVIQTDELLHTAARPFCDDDSCDCHEDPILIAEVNEDYQAGLLSAGDASRRVRGRTI